MNKSIFGNVVLIAIFVFLSGCQEKTKDNPAVVVRKDSKENPNVVVCKDSYDMACKYIEDNHLKQGFSKDSMNCITVESYPNDFKSEAEDNCLLYVGL